MWEAARHVHLQPGEDVHQAVLGHSVHDALAVPQHRLKLSVPPTVGRAEAQRADDVGDGPGELGRQIQGQSGGRGLRQEAAQRPSFCTDWRQDEPLVHPAGTAQPLSLGQATPECSLTLLHTVPHCSTRFHRLKSKNTRKILRQK